MRSKILLATLCAALFACGDDSKCAEGSCDGSDIDAGSDKDSGSDEGDGTDPTGTACPEEGTELTYEDFGENFFSTYCLGCHSEQLEGADRGGAPSDYNFDTVELIRQHAEHIDETTAVGPDASNSYMPPAGDKPSEAVRKQLGEWLACGAP